MAYAPAHRVTSEKRAVARQLALEIRSWKFGYAVIEGSSLMDWGIRWFPPGEPSSAIRRLAFLLKMHAPSIVVARRTRGADHESSKSAAQVLGKIRDELRRRSIRFAVLARRDVRKFFAQQGYRNKYGIATAVADRFRQLKPRVPRPRKAWDPERAITPVFDAIATAIAFEAFQEFMSNV